MTGKPEARWVNRWAPEMAMVAEVVGTTTDLIMAVAPQKGGALMVLFTPGYPEDETIWVALLEHDADGILVERLREPRPGMVEEMKAKLNAEFGKPE